MGRLRTLEKRLFRLQLAVALGLVALVLGSALSSWLFSWLTLEEAPRWAVVAVAVPVEGLWAWLLLPLFSSLAARVTELQPALTAVTGVLSGALAVFVLAVAAGGLESLGQQWLWWLSRVVTWGLGGGLTFWAVRRGRARALAAQREAELLAQRNREAYAAMVRPTVMGRSGVDSPAGPGSAGAPASPGASAGTERDG